MQAGTVDMLNNAEHDGSERETEAGGPGCLTFGSFACSVAAVYLWIDAIRNLGG